MAENPNLDRDLAWQLDELERKKAELPQRQAIRTEMAQWQIDNEAVQKRLACIQAKCKHPEETGYHATRGRDGKWTCTDCHRVRTEADLSDFR